MFNLSKYTKIYYNIVNRAKSRIKPEFAEQHHIIPKSLGGSNSKNNLVFLTPREHFICHLLLPKMTISEKHRQQMIHAAVMMSGKKLYNSRCYDSYRIEFQKQMSIRNSGERNPMFGVSRRGKENPNFGKRWSEEMKQKASSRHKGRPATQKKEDRRWYNTNGIFNSMTTDWQIQQKTRISNLRKSEIHYCEKCNQTIKTNGNWIKHLKHKHHYTESMIAVEKENLKKMRHQ